MTTEAFPRLSQVTFSLFVIFVFEKWCVVNNSETMHSLELLGEGIHHCGWWKGYIEVEKTGQGWYVMWCSEKTTHCPLFGPAVSVHFLRDRVGLVCKSAISMWPVRDETEKEHWIDWLKKKVRRAIKKNIKRIEHKRRTDMAHELK